jgi:hypothetical protein
MAFKKSETDIAPAPAPALPPLLGQRIRYRDESGVESVADVVGIDGDGSLALKVLYRDGIAGTTDHSGVTKAVDGGPGWFFPETP